LIGALDTDEPTPFEMDFSAHKEEMRAHAQRESGPTIPTFPRIPAIDERKRQIDEYEKALREFVERTGASLGLASSQHIKEEVEIDKQNLKDAMDALQSGIHKPVYMTAQGWERRMKAADVLRLKAKALRDEVLRLELLAKEADQLVTGSALEVFLWHEANKINVGR
jgi:hypothetical protein